MSATPEIITGDNVALAVTLKKNGATFTISGSDTVKAMLVSTANNASYTSAISQSSSAYGADWANSLVMVEFAGSDTESITFQGLAKLEIQVTQSGKNTTFFVPVIIVKGQIS